MLRRSRSALLWAALLPLMFLLRPYGGIIQDAWIYIGRGLADRDPTGLGRDILFAHDAQTDFTLFRPIVRMLLAGLTAGETSRLLVSVGLVAWLVGAALLVRRIASGRVAWAATVAILVLPSDYGGFAVFHYAEPVATPRLFAEAAIMLGLALLLDGRRLYACGLLAAALLLHPLMALPGLVLGGVLLIVQDRRWLAPIAATAVLLLAAAAWQVPLLGRLFVVMDPTWFSLVRHRSLNLFPSLWPAEDYARIGCLAAAAVVAGSLSAPPGRALLWGGVAVASSGLGAALLFGDAVPSVLILQLQPWRALWLLTLLGNMGLALAIIRLWTGNPVGQVTLACLVTAWSIPSSPIPGAILAVVAVALRVADHSGRLHDLSRRIGRVALGAALLAASLQTIGEAVALVRLYASPDAVFRPLGPWPYILASGVMVLPAMAAAAAIALTPEWLERHTGLVRHPWLAGAGILASLTLAVLFCWDGRTDENRLIEAQTGAAELDRSFGERSGEVLWIDDRGETWFFLGRPVFMNVVQGAPILFSRDLALEWADRANLLLRLGLVRPTALTPLGPAADQDTAISLAQADVAGFCADRRHPAGLVVPGSHLDEVPPDLTARLWTPPLPFQHHFVDASGPHWRAVPIFTVVQCATSAAASHPPTAKVGDE